MWLKFELVVHHWAWHKVISFSSKSGVWTFWAVGPATGVGRDNLNRISRSKGTTFVMLRINYRTILTNNICTSKFVLVGAQSAVYLQKSPPETYADLSQPMNSERQSFEWPMQFLWPESHSLPMRSRHSPQLRRQSEHLRSMALSRVESTICSQGDLASEHHRLSCVHHFPRRMRHLIVVCCSIQMSGEESMMVSVYWFDRYIWRSQEGIKMFLFLFEYQRERGTEWLSVCEGSSINYGPEDAMLPHSLFYVFIFSLRHCGHPGLLFGYLYHGEFGTGFFR